MTLTVERIIQEINDIRREEVEPVLEVLQHHNGLERDEAATGRSCRFDLQQISGITLRQQIILRVAQRKVKEAAARQDVQKEAAEQAAAIQLEELAARIAPLEASMTKLEATVKEMDVPTVSASSITECDLHRVLDEYPVLLLPAPESKTVDELFGHTAPEPPFLKWEHDKTEPTQRQACLKEIRSWLSHNLVAKDVANEFRSLRLRSLKLCGNGDVVVVPEPLSENPVQWALFGIELKQSQHFTVQAVRQALAQFLLFASRSRLPYVQIVTDMNWGAVMYYHSGPTIMCEMVVKQMVLLSMEAVKARVEGMCRNMRADIGHCEERDGLTMLIAPPELPEPKRCCLDLPEDERQRCLEEVLVVKVNDEDDVANLEDLEVFETLPEFNDCD